MTTLIVNKSCLLEGDCNEYNLLLPIYYYGVKQNLLIYAEGKIFDGYFEPDTFIAISGNLKESVKPFIIKLEKAIQTSIPNGNYWLGFIVHYFVENNISTIKISQYNDGFTISTCLEYYYIWCHISADKKTIKKIEFGRFTPLEKPEYVRKSSSWTKGVFSNSNSNFIEFRQTSWDGEYNKRYLLHYSKENIDKLLKFLEIPFNLGWTEINYRFGKDNYYKASAMIKTNKGQQTWTFMLKDTAEQDIPLVTDMPLRFTVKMLGYIWGRQYDTTIVRPILAIE